MIRASSMVLLMMGPALTLAAPVPSATPQMLKAIREARQANHLDEAEKLLKDYESREGDPETVRMEWLLLRAQRGETAAQKELHALLEKKDVDAAPILEALAWGYMGDSRFSNTAAILERWLKRDPKSTNALFMRGLLRASRGLTEDAEQDFRRVLELEPNHLTAQFLLAVTLSEQHKYDQAIPLFERFLKSHKDDPQSVIGLARCRYGLGDLDAAKKLLDDFLLKQPKSADALTERAKLALQDGEFEKVEKMLRQALTLDPSNVVANYYLVLCLQRLGRIKEAAELADRNKKMDVDSKELNKLMQQFDKSPEDHQLRHEIAVILLRLHRDDEAVRWWKSALREKPDYAPTHRAMADYYEKAGKKELAEQHRKLAERSK